ncbi:MAG: hypothetical protein IT290_07775 [Deltaproteobacteria bacterium]|nr:hypothetical protein [Deltaproteobacteria bacterium]
MRKTQKSAGRFGASRNAIREVRRIISSTDGRASQIAVYLRSSEIHRGARLAVLARFSRRHPQMRSDVLGAIESLADSQGAKPLHADLIVLRLSLAATREWYEQGIEVVFNPANFDVTPGQIKRLCSALRSITTIHSEWVVLSRFVEHHLELVLDAAWESGELSELARMLLQQLPDESKTVEGVAGVLTSSSRRFVHVLNACGKRRAARVVATSLPRAS